MPINTPIKTVGELKQLLSTIDDSMKLRICFKEKVSDEELAKSDYPYSHRLFDATIELDDISYSENVVQLGVEKEE